MGSILFVDAPRTTAAPPPPLCAGGGRDSAAAAAPPAAAGPPAAPGAAVPGGLSAGGAWPSGPSTASTLRWPLPALPWPGGRDRRELAAEAAQIADLLAPVGPEMGPAGPSGAAALRRLVGAAVRRAGSAAVHAKVPLLVRLRRHVEAPRYAELVAVLLGPQEVERHLPVDPFGLKRLASGDDAAALAAAQACDFASVDLLGRRPDAANAAAPATAASPPLLHWIWLGSPLPAAYEPCLRSFCRHNPGTRLLLWTDQPAQALAAPGRGRGLAAFCAAQGIRALPIALLGAAVRAAGLEQTLAERLLHRQYGGASDILRIVVLHALGGTYVDVDRTCQRPLPALRQHAVVLYGEPDLQAVVNNDFLAARPGHPLLAAMMAQMRRPPCPRGFPASAFGREDEAVLQATGPAALKRTFDAWREAGRSTADILLLGDAELGELPSSRSLCTRGDDMAWRRAERAGVLAPQAPPPSPAQLATCLLDECRLFGDVELRRYAAALDGGPLEAAALRLVAAELLRLGGAPAPAAATAPHPPAPAPAAGAPGARRGVLPRLGGGLGALWQGLWAAGSALEGGATGAEAALPGPMVRGADRPAAPRERPPGLGGGAGAL